MKAKSILLFISMVLLLTGNASGATIYVNGSNTGTENGTTWASGWSTIQEGINNATTGDNVTVSTGTYTENVDVNVSVNLTGAGVGVTIVQAAVTTDHVFYVTANSVNISGLTVTGATGSAKAGVYLYNSNYSKIENVNASNNNLGIYLKTSNNNTITDNNVSNNNNCGIYLYESSNNTIANNNASNNNNCGIYLDTSSNNTITDNTASKNSHGIRLVSSNNNTIDNNTASGNGDYGISLQSSSNNTIYNNYFNNTANFYSPGTNSNDWNTTKQAGTNIIGGPYLGGNFWAYPNGTGFSETCSDADGDGICDTSYTLASGNVDHLPLAKVAGQYMTVCGTIDQPGYYRFGADITDSGAPTCINITTSDVIFDGQGYTIDGVDTSNTYGVYVYDPSTALSNVTVKNLNVTDWYYGIYYRSAEDGSISNNNISNNNNCGIYLYNSSNNTITNNNASNNNNCGIYLDTSSNNTITDNNASNNTNYGIFLDSSSNNTLTDNNASNNTIGILLVSSSNNTIANNTASKNSHGIRLVSSNNNTIDNNTASGNGDYGISLQSSSNNTIYNNYFNNTANFYSPGTNSNDWNTTKQAGTNIIGGPYLGGNFWAYPNGTGFSETCSDADGDGICDSNYTLASGNVDYLPLTYRIRNLNTNLTYPTIQAAVDAASAGDTISVPAGTYNENVDVNKSVNLVGAGAGVTIVQAASLSDHVFNVTGVNWVNISGFTVTGATGTDKAGIYLSNSNYSKIENGNASDNYYGIYVYYSSNNTITNNNASDNTQRGIYLYNSSNNTITNNNASNNEDPGISSGYGIYLDSSSSNTLTNNTANSNAGFGYGIGIYLDSSSSNTLTNNTANSNQDDGIGLEFSSNNNTITSNNASNNGYGITLGSSNNNTITNNTASNNYDGILLSNSNYSTIVNNTANSNSDDGIGLGSSSNNTVENNTASNNGYGITLGSSSNNTVENNNASNNGCGICLFSSNNNTVENNTASNNTNHGIELWRSNNNNITNNTANSNNDTGIYLNWVDGFSNYNTLANNTASNNANYGIWVSYSSYNTIANNTASNNTNYGIYLESSSNNIIYNNYFNNTNNAGFSGTTSNYWNTTNATGPNIVGGPYLGGNFWAYPNGTGFSETCDDSDSDGYCDTSTTLAASNIDYLPLAEVVGQDFTAPTITMASPENITYTTTLISLNVSADESTSPWWYQYNGNGTNITFTPNETFFAGGGDGLKNITVWTNDTAGNENYSTVWFTVYDAPNTNISEESNVSGNNTFENSTINGTSQVVDSNVIETTVVNSTLEDSNVSDSTIAESTNVTGSTVEGSTVNASTITNATIAESANVTGSTVEGSTVNASTITNATIAESTNVSNSTVEQSNISGSTVESVVADNLNMSNSSLTNATVSNAIIIDNVINGSTNATIELTEEGVTVNFTEVYEDAPLDELITNTNVSTTNISVNETITVVNDTDDGNYSVSVDANGTINGTMTVAETIINPGGKALPSKVSGTKFLFINAPNFNSSVMRAATVRMKHYKTCAQFSSIKIQKFNESDPTGDWSDLTSWCSGDYIYANTTGFSVFAVAGTLAGTPPPSGGGGGGGAEAKNVTINATVEDGNVTGTFSKISSGTIGTMVIPDEADVTFEELAIAVKATVINAEIVIYKLSEKPGTVSEDISGETQSYIQLDETNIVAADIDSVSIKFKVPVSWITDENIDRAKVVLNRYADGTWNALATTKTGEDSTYVHYSTVSPGLSTFGVSGEVQKVEPVLISVPTTTPAPVTTAPPTTAPPTTVGPPEKEEGKKFLGICGPTFILLIALLPGLIGIYRREPR